MLIVKATPILHDVTPCKRIILHKMYYVVDCCLVQFQMRTNPQELREKCQEVSHRAP